MKYFTKYLPVEGEIKEGDYYLNNGTPTKRTEGTEDKSYLNQQKVKLFLCSRDIQVGDTVHYPLNNYIPVQWLGGNLTGHEFKVIGEISPNAIWVKEGDEFDEDQIKLTTPFVGYVCLCKEKSGERQRSCIYYYEMPHGSCSEGCARTETKKVFLIKGPCGHYH